jgi:Fe-S-cluster containining protein
MNDELTLISKLYGTSCLQIEVDKFYFVKRADGRCIFQVPISDRWICGIQKNKPMACQVWPFIVMTNPEYGYPELALFVKNRSNYYVYIDSKCNGIGWLGKNRIDKDLLSEIIEISIRTKKTQSKSTSMLDKTYDSWQIIQPQIFSTKTTSKLRS